MNQYRRATANDLERLWARSIADHRGEPQWIAWKAEFIRYNQTGMGVTFAVIHNGQPIGEGTLAVRGNPRADGIGR